MKPLSRNIARAVILAFVFCAHSLPAQEAALKAELTTLSWKGKTPEFWYGSKAGPRMIEAYERGFTAPVDYAGSRTIAFHPDKATLELPPEKQPAPIATAVLPPGGGELLLLFTEKPGETPPWQVRVIDNSARSLPPGAYRLVNLTQETFTASFDETTSPVEADGITIIRPAEEEDGIRDLPVRFHRGETLVYSSIWGHQTDRRGTVFLIPGRNGGQVISIRRHFQAARPADAGDP